MCVHKSSHEYNIISQLCAFVGWAFPGQSIALSKSIVGQCVAPPACYDEKWLAAAVYGFSRQDYDDYKNRSAIYSEKW